MKMAPIPRDARIIPGRTSLAYEPWTGIRANRSSPTIVSTMPTAVTGRTPTRGARAERGPARLWMPGARGESEPSGDHDPGRERQEGDARLQRAKAERALDVLRVEEEHREHPREGEEHRQIRRRERADAEDRKPDERLGRALLDQGETAEKRSRRDERDEQQR